MTLRSLAIVDRMQGRFDQAHARLVESLPVLREVGDLSSQAHVLNNLAQVALERRETEAALELALESVAVSERIGRGGERNLAQSVHRLAHVHLALGNRVRAAVAFRKVIGIVRAQSDWVGLAHATFGLAQTQLAAGEVDAAFEGMTEALRTARQSGSPLLEGQIVLTMAQIESRRGNRDRAETWLAGARTLFVQTGSLPWLQRSAEMSTLWRGADADIGPGQGRGHEAAGLDVAGDRPAIGVTRRRPVPRRV